MSWFQEMPTSGLMQRLRPLNEDRRAYARIIREATERLEEE